MGEFIAARQRIARSERLRVTLLACLTGVLAILFLALLVADGVQAARI